MPLSFHIAVGCIDALWLIWVCIWMVAALRVKKTVFRQPLRERLIYVALIVLAIIAMQLARWWRIWLFYPNMGSEALGVMLCAAGLAWAVWARFHLGGNWSGQLTIKENHELIQSGPYSLTRHPIYTGIVMAIVGTVVALTPTLGGAAGIALATASLVIKLRQEERAMLRQFPEAYPSYKNRVRAALVPWII